MIQTFKRQYRRRHTYPWGTVIKAILLLIWSLGVCYLLGWSAPENETDNQIDAILKIILTSLQVSSMLFSNPFQYDFFLKKYLCFFLV